MRGLQARGQVASVRACMYVSARTECAYDSPSLCLLASLRVCGAQHLSLIIIRSLDLQGGGGAPGGLRIIKCAAAGNGMNKA